MKSKIRWAFLLSGYGASAISCFDLYKKTLHNSHEFVVLITDGQKTPAEEVCKSLGMQVITDSARSFDSIEAYQIHLIDKFKSLEIDYIFLLNYHYRIRSIMLDAFSNRIINIHPSLLPSFKNTKSAIQDAMKYGVKVSGITTHIIDEEIDGGIILVQKPVMFEKNEHFDTIIQKYRDIAPQVFLDTFNLIKENHHPTKFLDKLVKIN